MNKHAKRKANASAPMEDERRKIDKTSKDLEESCSERRVRLVSNTEADDSSRKVVFVSDSDDEVNPEYGFGLTLSVLELESIETVRSQVFSRNSRKIRAVRK